MVSPLYMAEISPPEVRGSLVAIEQFAIVLGVVFGFWTGFFTRDCMLLLSLWARLRIAPKGLDQVHGGPHSGFRFYQVFC
jgi:hypothetical protein